MHTIEKPGDVCRFLASHYDHVLLLHDRGGRYTAAPLSREIKTRTHVHIYIDITVDWLGILTHRSLVLSTKAPSIVSIQTGTRFCIESHGVFHKWMIYKGAIPIGHGLLTSQEYLKKVVRQQTPLGKPRQMELDFNPKPIQLDLGL